MKINNLKQSFARLLLLAMLFAIPLCFHAQNKVTLKGTQVTLKEVFKAIEKQTGMSVDYDGTLVDANKVVNTQNANGTVHQVLGVVLKNTGYTFNVNGKHIAIYASKASQPITQENKSTTKIRGVVKDHSGEPIVGATITAKGTQLRTITDMDGKYEITIPTGTKSLEVSYIGFVTQDVSIKNNTNINISLQEDAQGLSEVVVVGYGTQKKANLIGAVSTVTASDLKDRPVNNLGQMLQGQVPNLNITFASGTPGESTIMNIRGATSILNSGAPLVLIDGVEGSIDRVNPNDIESISVLKDAASAAIYGARAGFGVILVTTKSNKNGEARISYNGRFSVSAPTTNTDFITTGYDAARIADAFNIAMNGSSYTNYTASDYAELEARRNDKTENPERPWAIVGSDGKYRYYGNFDWYNYIYDFKQPTWNHNLSVTGGTEKFNYVVSANHNQHTGIFAVGKNKYKTKTFTTKVSSQVKPWLKLTSSAMLFRSDYNAPGYDYEDGGNFDNLAQHALPYVLPYNPDGSSVYTYAPSPNKPTNGFVAMLQQGNGFANVKNTQSTYSVNANIRLMEGLSITGNVSYRLYYKEKMTRQANMTYSEKPGVYEKATTVFFQNRLKEIRTTEEYWVYDVYANYQKTFNNSHNFNAVIGFNHETGKRKNVEGNVKDLPSMSLNDLALGTGDRGVKGGQHEYALLGYFGRLSYDYNGKYLAEVNMRYDGTSRFPAHNRWGLFPSLALGWRVSDEAFFQPLKKVVDNAKVRFSIGSLGNQVTDKYTNPYYPYIRNAKIRQSNLINYLANDKFFYYIALDAPVSSDLTWETIVTKNFGLDLGFFNNRLNVVLDIYQRDTKDMLAASITLPDVYGYPAPRENNGQLRTRGYELAISWNDRFMLKGKPFAYGVSLSLADSKSKLVKYNGNETKILGKEYEGMEWGEIWGYRIEGIYQTDQAVTDRNVDQSFINSRFTNKAGDLIFADIDGSKKINKGKGTLQDHGDLVKLGNSLPRYHYGISGNASWNGFDLSMFFQGIGKQNFYPGAENVAFWGPYSRVYSSFVPTDFEGKVWTENNLDSYFPRAAGNIARSGGVLTHINDRYLQDLAYCRLKNLTVGYTLPKTLTQRFKIEKVRLYFSGENLLTFSKLDSDYLDPEQISGKGGSGQVYPYSKSFSFGLDVTF